jgi:hypothetical protein
MIPQDTAGFVNLKYIASHVIMDRNIDDRMMEKVLQYVIDGYGVLAMNNIFPSQKVVYLTVNEQNTVSVPRDFIDYILIAINSGGRYWTLTRNRNLVTPANMSCGEWNRDPITTTSNELGQGNDYTDGYRISDHEYMGESVAGMYAMGGGFNTAYYRYDPRNRQLIFLTDESFAGMTIIMEYLSSGVNAYTVVPRDAIQALVAFVHWKMDNFDRNLPMNMKIESKSQWRTERDKLYAKSHAFTMDEFLDEKYMSLSQGVKR